MRCGIHLGRAGLDEFADSKSKEVFLLGADSATSMPRSFHGPIVGAVSEDSSLEHLLEDVRRMAYKAAYGRIRDHHLAEDVAQEITDEFHRRRAEIRDPNRWVPMAAKRHAKRRLDQHQRRGIVGGDTASVDPPFYEGPISNPSREANRIVMRDARRKLPAKDRQILELYYLSDFPLSEIAELLGIDELAAQKRLQRARERAEQRWGDDEGIRIVLQRR